MAAYDFKSSVNLASNTASLLRSLSVLLSRRRAELFPPPMTSSTSCRRSSRSSSMPFKLSCISALSSNRTSPSSVPSGCDPGWKSSFASRCISWTMALFASDSAVRRVVRVWVVDGRGGIVSRRFPKGDLLHRRTMTERLERGATAGHSVSSRYKRLAGHGP
jgi:hypothetical protein